MVYMKSIITSPISDASQNKEIVTRIYVQFISIYCSKNSDTKNYKGWSQ